MIIYLDTCCYGRQYDDQKQNTIVKETAAIADIIEMCKTNDYCIVGSLAVTSELADISNGIKRKTTDADFIKISTKKNLSVVKVINPLKFEPEV